MIRALKYIFLFFVVVFVAAWLLLTSSTVQQKAAEAIENMVFEATGMHVEMSRISLSFPDHIVIDALQLKDDQQDLILSAKHAALSIDFSLIFQGVLPKFSLEIDHAKLYAIPKLPESNSQLTIQQPELILLVKELEIAPSILEKLELPEPFSISSLTLKDLTAYSFNDEVKISGDAHIESIFEKKALHINTHFQAVKDLGLTADFNGLYHDVLPFDGKLVLSSLMQIDGSELHFSNVDLASLKDFNIPEGYQGDVSGNVLFSGPFTTPELNLHIRSETLTLNTIVFRNTSGGVSGKINNQEALGTIAFTSSVNGKDISLGADFNWPFKELANISSLNIMAPGADLHANLTLSAQDKWIEGDATGTLYDLSFLDLQLPVSFSAPITYELMVPRTDKQEPISAHFNMLELLVSELAIQDVVLKVSIENMTNSLKANVDLFAAHGMYHDIEIEKFSLQTSLSETINAHPFNLSLNGKNEQSSFEIHSEGAWQNQKDSWQLDLHTLAGNAFNLPFNLSEPISIVKDTQTFTLSPFSLAVGNGAVTGSVAYREEEIQGALKVNSLPLDSLPSKLVDFPVKGTLTLDASITGQAAHPKVQVKIDTKNLIVDAFSKIRPSLGEVTFLLENNLFSGVGEMTSASHSPIHFDLQFPVIFSLNPLLFTLDPQAPLQGNIAAQGEIAPLLHLLLDNPTTFAGFVDAALNLTGTVTEPQINGVCKLTHGSYEIPEIGVSLKDLKATLVASGAELQINDLEAFDGKDGKVTGSGYFHIDKEQHNPFALEMNLVEAALLNQDYVQIVCNGPLTFKGNSEEGILTGQLQVSKASVTIPERSYSTINTVEVTYVNLPENAPKPQSLNINNSSWPLALDIHLTVPRSLSVKGRDLTSTWKGEIAVQGLAKSPLLFGELKIIEGEYLFNGNPFAINQGTITFAGDLDKKTTLYVIASKDLDKVKVDVIAKGPIKNPALSFRSNPPLPQREILSWILFNRGTSEISSFQGTQLSESITNLSTNQQGPDVLSKIRSTLGIDRFEICRNPKNDNNEVNVQVGKYISDNVLISVIKSDVNRLALEATVTDKIKLQAQVGDDAQGQLLLKWKRDY